MAIDSKKQKRVPLSRKRVPGKKKKPTTKTDSEIRREISELEARLAELSHSLLESPPGHGGFDRASADILQNLPVAVIVTRIPGGVVLFANNHVHELLEIKPEELQGRSAPEFFANPDDRTQLLARLEAEGFVNNFEVQLKTRNGRIFWANSQIFRSAFNGQPCYINIVTDLSHRKSMEDQLKNREQQLQLIFQATASPIFLINVESQDQFRFASVNNAFFAVTGLRPEQIIGRHVHEILPQASLDMVIGKYKQALETGRLVQWEEVTEYPTGAKTGIVSVVPVMDSHGKPVQLVGSVHDITERAEVERALKNSYLTLRNILDSVPVAIGISNPTDGKVLYANQSTADMAETRLDEIIGHTVSRFYDNPNDRETMIARLKNEGRVSGFEGRFKTNTGKIRWVHYSLSTTEFEGRPAMLAALVDITERRRTELSLKEAHSFAQLGRWELDLLSNRLEWSDTIFEIFEIDPERFGASYDAFLEAIHPEDREKVNEAYISSLETRQPYEIEHRLLMRDGRIKWVLEFCRTDYNEAAQAIRSVGIVQDITKRKLASLEIVAAHARVKDLETALHVHSIVAITDAKGIITQANEEFCRISGYSREELLGQDHRILNSGYHPKEFFREMWQTIRDGKVWKGVLRNKAKNGSFYWVNTTIVPFFGEDEKPYQYVAIRVDITAQKEAEEALRQSEAHFRSVTEDSPAYISVFLSDGTITFVNPALARLFGKTPREMVGNNFMSWVPAEEGKQALARIKSRTPQDPVSVREQKIRLPNGEEVWQLWTTRAFFDDSGKLINLQSFGQDITAQKLAERNLRHAQRRVTTTLNTMIDGMVEVNLKGEIVYANRGAERILNISLNEITGKYFQSREWRQIDAAGNPLPPENLPLAVALAECREVGPVEHPLIGDAGQWKWISVYAAPLLNSAGELYGAVATFRDITEQIRQSEAIRASEERFRKIFELSPVGILEYDAQGVILTANPKLCEIYGAKAEQLVGISLFDTITHEDMLLALEHAVTGKPSDVESDYRSVVSGKQGYVRSVFSPVMDTEGRVKGGVIISEDVTMRRQADAIARERESYKMLFEQAAVGVVLVDAQTGKFVRVNRRFGEFLGYSSAELMDMTFWDITHPEDTQVHVDKYSEMQAGEIAEFSVEKRYLRKDGKIVWANVTVGRTWKPGETPTRHISVVQDITDRKEAEAARERARILHGTLMVMNNIADAAINSEDFGTSMLALTAKTLGLQKMMLLKLSLSEGLMVEVATDVTGTSASEERGAVPMEPFIRHQIASGEDLIFTDWHLGKTIPLPDFFAGSRMRLSLMMAEPDLPLYLLWAHGDSPITRDEAEAQFLNQLKSILTAGLRKIRNEKFFASNARLYQSVIASMNDIHWVSSPEMRKIYYVNPAFEAITGYTAQEFIDNPALLFHCVFPADRSLYAENLARIKDGPVDFVVRITRKDSAKAWLRIRTSPLKTPGGKLERESFIATDVTAEKNRDLLRQQFHLELIELQENDRAEFARELHDSVGQNLIILKFILEPLKKKLPEPDQESLMKGVAMITEIIENNRNISRRISPFHIEKLGLRAAIEDLLEKINLDGRYHITTELKALDKFFPNDWNIQLYRIVQECLTNIMKHSAAKHIDILVSSGATGLTITVTNDGLKAGGPRGETGIGRRIMNERAALIKAKITAASKGGQYEVKIAIER